MRLGLVVLALLALLPSSASAARFAVGILPGWSGRKLAARVERETGNATEPLLPGYAIVARTRNPRALRRLRGVAYVQSLDVKRKLSFATDDPLAPRQWYLQRDHAFDFWPAMPVSLSPVKVAIVDSGIDGGHPEFPASRIAAAKSFVGGSPYVDTDGHGTFVAGEIAAQTDNGVGISGIAFPARLLIAKVVDSSGDLPLEAEIKGIRWAADEGAKVINLSLGGVRDPLDAKLDTYSPAEQAAVDYAIRKGAVVVAAVGNGPQSPREPWPYAHYPSALPHVLGVSAITQSGAVPDFSNRDRVYNDIAAPGEAILSTVPRQMTAALPGCADQGYSPCGTSEFREAIGTSFAAPQVAAAAALVRSVRPDLHPDQVVTLLERTADDANPATGCVQCPVGRDRFSGWGTLDIAKALQAATTGSPLIPPPDEYEPNDEAKQWAYPMWGARGREIHATLDYWDDQLDVYSVVLRKGQRLFARLAGPAKTKIALSLWLPGTKTVDGISAQIARRAALSDTSAIHQKLAYKAAKNGTYYLAVKLQSEGNCAYTLSFSKTKIS